MKRTVIPAILLCLALAACGVVQTPVDTPAPSAPASGAPASGAAEHEIEIPSEPYSYLTFENDWLTLRDAYAAVLEPYAEWLEAKQDDGSPLLIEAKETLTDLSFCATNMDEDGNYSDGEVFYTLDELTPETPLVLEVMFYGDMTAYGMSITDSGGETHRLLLTMGGRGPDEACPYSLTEY